MNTSVSSISFNQLRAVSDPQRLMILRRLMESSATLSQLGERLQVSAAHVRHHLLILEKAGLVEMVETRPIRGFQEKYYRATSAAFLVRMMILPEENQTIVVGSMDYAVTRLVEETRRMDRTVIPMIYPLSSLDGLINLRQGICQMATCHLFDAETGEYNLGTIRKIFPGQSMVLFHLYEREEGFIVQPGNPLGLKKVDDLTRRGLRIAVREPGSGVRTWMDHAVRKLGMRPEEQFLNQVVFHSHTAAALAVREGKADVALGIRSAAEDLGLDYYPLFEEPYDLVFSETLFHDPALASFFEYLQSKRFHQNLKSETKMRGYQLPPVGSTSMIIS